MNVKSHFYTYGQLCGSNMLDFPNYSFLTCLLSAAYSVKTIQFLKIGINPTGRKKMYNRKPQAERGAVKDRFG